MTALPALRCHWVRDGAPSLLVLLPGAYIRPGDFLTQGFPDAVARAGQHLDLCFVDLDLEQISGGQALAALHEQILAPARSRHTRVWLGGISLGGLLSLCYAADYPGQLDGLCLLAPYPGSRITARTIASAGGLQHWQADADALQDPEFRVWHWLRSPPPDLPVFVGYGREDRFAPGMDELAGCFPPGCCARVPGGHDWSAWRPLWEQFLAQAPFPRQGS